MTLRRRHRRAAVAVVALIAVTGVGRHLEVSWLAGAYRPLMLSWSAAFAFSAAQWILSYRDRPFTDRRGSTDRLRVTVNIPLYNEDPDIVDRALYSLLRQTRPPQRVDVVDDGSAVSYARLRRHWARTWPCGTQVRWVRQANAGKKHAQAVTFTSDPAADIFVTVDSDTALEERAIEEGLKPFRHRRVMAVAGVELAFNSRVNWLTRTVAARSLFFQIVACGAQSAAGDVLVNRGAFALYRAPMIRDVVPAYLDEEFLGVRPILLGDDAALTLFARGRGKAVQQPTAFALTMYPETLSHHFRQWTRWMRGSTIRNCWRVRYLPVWSWGWWFTVLGVQFFLASVLLPVLAAVTWPSSRLFVEGLVCGMLAWAYVTATRMLAVHRSDEGWWYRLGTLLCYPAAMLWAALVLRPLRFYGMATWKRQGWTTRNQGAEIGITGGQKMAA